MFVLLGKGQGFGSQPEVKVNTSFLTTWSYEKIRGYYRIYRLFIKILTRFNNTIHLKPVDTPLIIAIGKWFSKQFPNGFFHTRKIPQKINNCRTYPLFDIYLTTALQTYKIPQKHVLQSGCPLLHQSIVMGEDISVSYFVEARYHTRKHIDIERFLSRQH